MPKKKHARVSATAKLEAVAKASYSRKRTTTEVIPADVTRAKAGAWLDLISPFTEWAALKGDQLRFRREQLRLQREDVLAEIVKRAREKIGPIVKATPIPNKFLVPFLEQASLESRDSFLIDMWANLLASAAQGRSSYHVHFVSIISQLSSKQGQLFEMILGTKSARSLDLARDNILANYQSHRIRGTVENLVKELPERTSERFFDSIEKLFNHVGIELIHAAAEELKTKDYYDIGLRATLYNDDDEVDYSILDAVDLIRRVEIDFFEVGDWALTLSYFYLTDLGYHFALACGLVELDFPSEDTE